MAFDVTTINLDAIAKDTHDASVTAMNRDIIDMLVSGEADKVLIRGKKYFVTLEPIIDDKNFHAV